MPKLAAAVASRHPSGEEPDLESLYEQTLVILLRLLFVAYAEDKDLLPYRSSRRILAPRAEAVARELGERLTEGPRDFDAEATDLWATVIQLSGRSSSATMTGRCPAITAASSHRRQRSALRGQLSRNST